MCVREGETFEYGVQQRLVEHLLLHIAQQPLFGLLKCLESCLSGQCRQDVTGILSAG